MSSRIIDNNALSQLIKEVITNDIIMGKIKPGDKLIEAKYAAEFGTSRAPIREAFYLLTMEGFVEKIPRKGTVVKGFSVEEISDLLEIRCFLEDLALRKAKPKNLSSCFQQMEEIIRQMEENQDKTKDYARLNQEFHLQLIKASESHVIMDIYSRLGTPLLSVQTMSFMEEQNIKKSLFEHKQILEFMRCGDQAGARKLLSAHNKAVFPRIEGHFLRLQMAKHGRKST